MFSAMGGALVPLSFPSSFLSIIFLLFLPLSFYTVLLFLCFHPFFPFLLSLFLPYIHLRVTLNIRVVNG